MSGILQNKTQHCIARQTTPTLPHLYHSIAPLAACKERRYFATKYIVCASVAVGVFAINFTNFKAAKVSTDREYFNSYIES